MEFTDELLEQCAEAVHKAYCRNYEERNEKEYWTRGDYNKLDEETKEIDRATVRAVFATIKAVPVGKPSYSERASSSGDLASGAVAEIYNEFWKPLIENDGKIDKEKLMNELYDYHNVMEQVSRVYMELTNGRISKPNTMAYEVIAVVNDVYSER